MTTVIPGGYGQVVHQILLTGDPEKMVVTMGFGLLEAGSIDLAAFTADIHDAAGDNFMFEASNQHTLVATTTYFVPQTGSDPVVTTALGDRVGGSTTPTIPQNSAVLVQKRTAIAGRRGRGRFYLPSVPESAVGNTGVLDGTFRNNVQNKMTAYLARYNVGPSLGAVAMLLHQVEGAAPSTIPANLMPNPITQLVVDNMIATQRRRLRK